MEVVHEFEYDSLMEACLFIACYFRCICCSPHFCSFDTFFLGLGTGHRGRIELKRVICLRNLHLPNRNTTCTRNDAHKEYLQFDNEFQ